MFEVLQVSSQRGFGKHLCKKWNWQASFERGPGKCMSQVKELDVEIKELESKLSKAKQQEQAVFYALNRLAPGETTEWFNGNTGAHGLVQVASVYPQGSGYCRVVFTQIQKKGKARDFKETACKDVAYQGWQFIR